MKKNLDIDCLYVNGCSFTRMTTAPFPPDNQSHPSVEQQWPHLLGNLIGAKTVINDGIWNGNNYRIFRKLHQFLETTEIPHHKIFVIISFTTPWRFEYPEEQEYLDYANPTEYASKWIRINPGHADISIKPQYDSESYNKCVSIFDKSDSEVIERSKYKIYGKLLNYTDEVEFYEFLMQILAIDNLLKVHNVKHRYAMATGASLEICNFIQRNIPAFFENISVQNNAMPHLSIDKYHPDYLGNQKIAHMFADEMLR